MPRSRPPQRHDTAFQSVADGASCLLTRLAVPATSAPVRGQPRIRRHAFTQVLHPLALAIALRDDLSQDDVIAAIKKAGGPQSLETTLPPALAEVTGRRYRVTDDPRKWVKQGDRISEVTLTVEAIE